MPGRDGMGPLGNGPVTGRGLGNCSNANGGAKICRSDVGRGLAFGRNARCGCMRGFTNSLLSKTNKDALLRQKLLLQKHLVDVERRLED